MFRWWVSVRSPVKPTRVPRLFAALYGPTSEVLSPFYPGETGFLDFWRSWWLAQQRLSKALKKLDEALDRDETAKREASERVRTYHPPKEVQTAITEVTIELSASRALGWADYCLRQRTLGSWVPLASNITLTPFKVPLILFQSRLRRRVPPYVATYVMKVLLDPIPNVLGPIDCILRNSKEVAQPQNHQQHDVTERLNAKDRQQRQSVKKNDNKTQNAEHLTVPRLAISRQKNYDDILRKRHASLRQLILAQRSTRQAANLRQTSYKSSVYLALPLKHSLVAEGHTYARSVRESVVSDVLSRVASVRSTPVVFHSTAVKNKQELVTAFDVPFVNIHGFAGLIRETHIRTLFLKAHHENYTKNWGPQLVSLTRQALFAQYRFAQQFGFASPLHMGWSTTLRCAEAKRHTLDEIERRVIAPCFSGCLALVKASLASHAASEQSVSFPSWVQLRDLVLYGGTPRERPVFRLKNSTNGLQDLPRRLVSFVGDWYGIDFVEVSNSNIRKKWENDTLVFKAVDREKKFTQNGCLGYLYFSPYHEPTLAERVTGIVSPRAPEATVILPGHYRCKTELPPLEASKKHPEKTTLFSFAQIVQTLHELGHTVHFFYYHQALLQQPNNGLASFEMYTDINETFSQLTELTLHAPLAASYFAKQNAKTLGAPPLGDLFFLALRSQLEFDVYARLPENVLNSDELFFEHIKNIVQRRTPYAAPSWYNPFADADVSHWMPSISYLFAFPYLLGRLRAMEIMTSLTTHAPRKGNLIVSLNSVGRDALKESLFQEPSCVLTGSLKNGVTVETNKKAPGVMSVVDKRPLFHEGTPSLPLTDWETAVPSVLRLDAKNAAFWSKHVSVAKKNLESA